MNKRFLTYDVERTGSMVRLSYDEVIEKAKSLGEDWRIPTRHEIFSILDSDCGEDFLKFVQNRSFWVECGKEHYVMQFFSEDKFPVVSKIAYIAETALLFRDNIYDHMRNDIRFYESYASERAISILKSLGCVGKTYLNLDEYRGERGNNERPFVDIPDGIIQNPDDDFDNNSFVGVRLIEPIDEYETDYIVEFDTANGRLYNFAGFNIYEMYGLLYTLESIYKLIKNNEISLFTYPAPDNGEYKPTIE